METTIARSKYSVPTVQDIIERDRLFNVLDGAKGKRAVFVIGQAAQGKSTLIASYVKRMPEKTLWLHLDKEDSDHNNFYDLFINALCEITGMQMPSASSQTVSLGPRKKLLRQKEIINHHLSGLGEYINIVIDNTESVKSESGTFELIYEILKTGALINLFIISRVMPPFDIQEFRIKKEILLINNRELSFSKDETESFFARLLNLKIDSKTADQVTKMTDGWAGALVLLSESIKTEGDFDKLDYKAKFPDILSRESYDFFCQGIFLKQEENIRDFLSLASVFDIIDPEIIDRVTGKNDSRIILDVIEKRNLFIHTIGEGLDKQYRLNSLFREFLKDNFERDTDPERRKEILDKAAKVYEDYERYEDAMRFYIESKNHFMVCDMIIKTGTDFIIKGRDEELALRIATLPDEYLEKETWIFFYLALTKRIKGGHKNLTDLKEAFKRFTEEDKLRGRILSCAYLIESSVFLGRSPEKLMELLNKGREILDLMIGKELFTWGRTLLWQQIGFAFIAGGLDFSRGLSACKNSYILAGKINETALMISSLIVSAMGYAFTGDIGESSKALKEIDEIGENVSPEYRTLRNIVDISNSIANCDYEKTAILLDQCRENIEDHGLLFIYPLFVELSGHYEILNGRLDEALKTADHLTDISVLSGSDYYRGLSLKLSSLASYHMEDFKSSLKKSDEAVSILLKGGQSNYHGNCAKLIKLLSKINNLNFTDFEEFESLSAFFNDPRQFERSDALKALAVFSFIKGDLEKSGKYIKELKGIKPFSKRTLLSKRDELRFLLISGIDEPDLKDALKDFDSEMISESFDWIKRNGPSATFAFKGSRAIKDFKNSGLPKVEVITLGEFKVKVGERTIETYEWSGKKPLLLFKHILALGCFDIPKDLLIDAIWPESTPESGSRNFKVNLHRLRKVFDINGNSGASYIILKQNNLSLSSELFVLDFKPFEKKKENVKLTDSNIEEMKRIEKLYGGDFLSDLLYEDHIIIMREKLKKSYLKILDDLSSYFKNKGEIDNEIYYSNRILHADPLNEAVSRRLMTLLINKGKTNSAIKVYDELKRNLKREIGINPENATEELYSEILGKDRHI